MKKKADIEQEMQQALQDLGIENVDWSRRISASDVVYLLDQCPFLQISDVALPSSNEIQPLKIIQAKSRWKIHDYGNALSSSPGELLYGYFRRQTGKDEKGGEGGIGEAAPGVGTIINQAVITAFEMVELAKQYGWSGIQLIDGHPRMAWAAWMQALDSGIELEGYTPTAQDYAKRQRIRASFSEHSASYKPSR